MRSGVNDELCMSAPTLPEQNLIIQSSGIRNLVYRDHMYTESDQRLCLMVNQGGHFLIFSEVPIPRTFFHIPPMSYNTPMDRGIMLRDLVIAIGRKA